MNDIKKELKKIIDWSYKSNFATVYKYNPVDQTTKLSKQAKEKINKFISKLK